ARGALPARSGPDPEPVQLDGRWLPPQRVADREPAANVALQRDERRQLAALGARPSTSPPDLVGQRGFLGPRGAERVRRIGERRRPDLANELPVLGKAPPNRSHQFSGWPNDSFACFQSSSRSSSRGTLIVPTWIVEGLRVRPFTCP